MITHFKNIGLENFRVFKEKTEFDFAPITILTGTNSSGKSSLTKFIRLFSLNLNEFEIPRHGYENQVASKNKTNILFELMGLDFTYLSKELGDIETVLYNNEKASLSVSFKMFTKSLSNYTLEIQYDKKNDDAFFKNGILAAISIKDLESDLDVIKIRRQIDNTRFFDVVIDFNHFYLLYSSSPLKKFDYPIESIYDYDFIDYFFRDKEYDDHVLTKEEVELDFRKQLNFTDDNANKNEIKNFIAKSIIKDGSIYLTIEESTLTTKFIDFLPSLNSDNNLFNLEKKKGTSRIRQYQKDINFKFSDSASGCFFSDFFDNFLLPEIFTSLSNAIIPIVAIGYSGLTAIDKNKRFFEIKPSNEAAHGIVRIISIYMTLPKKSRLAIDKFINWAMGESCFGIAEKVEFRMNIDKATVSILIHNKGIERNLADVGFGVTSIIPIVFELAFANTQYTDSKILITNDDEGESYSGFISMPTAFKTVIFEEPESNLHPALQSKLADVFIQACKTFNLQLIIETHSEYLIRTLQKRTAEYYIDKKSNRFTIPTKSTQIYYFHHPDKVPVGESQVYPINILEDGGLTKKFGSGFFDVSSNLNIALYNF